MKILHLSIIAIFGVSFILSYNFVYAQSGQYTHGIGSNSSALYNSVGLTYQQCQNKIAGELQKIVDMLDRGKAVELALNSQDLQAKLSGHKYELTDISTNDTWDNSLCGNVKRTAVGVSFNLLDTPDTYIESVNVAEDANMTKVTQVGTTITPICNNNCPPALPPAKSDFVPAIASDFHISGVMVPNGTIPMSIDLANQGNFTLYHVQVAFVDSPLLQNFKTGYGNFTLQVGQEKTILGTISLPSQISNVSSHLDWMVYANNQDNATGSKEFQKTINLASKSTWIDNSISFRTVLAPLKQEGPVNEIECRQGLDLIIKSDDYSPACVTPSTNQTLIGRGWGESLSGLMEQPLIKKMEIDGLQQNYNTGQPINATVRYTGWSFHSLPDVKIFDANGTQVWYNCPECVTRTELSGISYPGVFGTYNYKIQNPDETPPIINKTGSYTMVASLKNKTAEANFTVTSQGNNTLPASFEPCQDPYPQKYQGIPVLYMEQNSTGKICVRYHNLNNFPVRVGIGISEADNLTEDATDVSTWNDSGNNTISAGDSTVVYWIKTGNNKGLYGLTIFCVPIPFAVGYDNSTLKQDDFPWLGQNTWFCPMEAYNFHIDSTTGFKVGYIQAK